MVCSVNKQSELACVASQLGEFKMVIPQGVGTGAAKVVAGVTSTAVIDTKGNLKFWFNYPAYDAEKI